jgi:hypothetical protein
MAKMKISLFAVFIFIFGIVSAQDDKKGLKLISASIGPSFSNLICSKAPPYFDKYESNFAPKTNYETSLTKETKTSFAFGLGFEHFLRNKLSISFLLNYELKGVDYMYSALNTESSVVGFYDETVERSISNSYLTLPILLKTYLLKDIIYIQGGFYVGYLIKSETYASDVRFLPPLYPGTIPNNSISIIDNEIDSEKEHTTNFDIGFSLGGGINYPFGDKLFFKIDYLMNVGLRKIDKKYNNDYVGEEFPNYSETDSSSWVNIYYGINSDAKNINMSLLFGIGIKI